MRRIVLPGFGTATTFNPKVDSIVTVLTAGRRIPIKLKAGQRTRVEFINSMGAAA